MTTDPEAANLAMETHEKLDDIITRLVRIERKLDKLLDVPDSYGGTDAEDDG